jgi:hypothetical protein
MRAVFGIVATGLTLLSGLAHGGTLAAAIAPDTLADTSRIIVRIEPRTIFSRRINDTLDITMESFGAKVAAFDLKIGLDNPFMRIAGVIPGAVIDSCGWQFFNAKEVKSKDPESHPGQLWHIVALAKMVSGDSTKPDCYGSRGAPSIARIIVSNEHVLQMPETTAAIFFYWEDCTDNCLSGMSGQNMLISASVVDFFPVSFLEGRHALPSRRGAPNQCIIPGKPNVPKRRVEFRNGGIRYVIQPPDNRTKLLDTDHLSPSDSLQSLNRDQ